MQVLLFDDYSYRFYSISIHYLIHSISIICIYYLFHEFIRNEQFVRITTSIHSWNKYLLKKVLLYNKYIVNRYVVRYYKQVLLVKEVLLIGTCFSYEVLCHDVILLFLIRPGINRPTWIHSFSFWGVYTKQARFI